MSLKEDAIYDQDGKFLGYLNCPVGWSGKAVWRGQEFRFRPLHSLQQRKYEVWWYSWKLEDRMTALILIGLGALRLEEQHAERGD